MDASSVLALRLTLILAAGVTFIILVVATADFFRRPLLDAGLRMQVHQAVAVGVGVAHVTTLIVSRDLHPGRALVAIGLYLSGLALFLWAQDAVKRRPPMLTFAESAPDGLIDSGPYRYIRHPFYTAFIIVWFAGVVATANLWLMASALWMTMRYAVAATEEELAYEQTPFASQYRLYRLRTGMFLPNLWLGRKTREEPPLIDRRLVLLVVLTAVALSVWLMVDALALVDDTLIGVTRAVGS